MKNLFLVTLCVLALISCEKESQEQFSKEQQNAISTTGKILKERDPNSPLILSKKRTKNLNSKLKSENEPFKECLGISFNPLVLPLTNYKNMAWSVIDIEKYLKDYPGGYYNVKIVSSESNYFAYTSFNRYVEKSKVSKKIKGGFKIDLGVFSIGAKSSMERVFSKTTINEDNRIYGELHYKYMDSRYWLKTSSNDIRNMKSYISKRFVEDLYNNTRNQLFEYYGKFVLCDFIVGGSATVLYSGNYYGNSSSETRGKEFGVDISASFGKTVSGEFGIGRGYSNGKESSNKFTNVRASAYTIGGIGGQATFSDPLDISSININLTSWLASLNNKNNHGIIEISDNGLVPITEFIREENIKHYIELGNSNKHSLCEPVVTYIHIKKLDWEVLFLSTRHGDGIKLYSGQKISDTYTQALIKKNSSRYKVKYVDYSAPVNEILKELDPLNADDLGIEHPYFKTLYDEAVNFTYSTGLLIDEKISSDMKKFIYNNTTYLISQKQGVKYAYSIHFDYILDTYGIREWVNNMPTTQLTQWQLDKYTTIAL